MRAASALLTSEPGFAPSAIRRIAPRNAQGFSIMGHDIMRNLGILALVVALAGCASSAADITPSYVSPVQYSSYTCQQLGLEAQSVSARAAALSGAQDSQRTKDAIATTAAVVIFWPAAFLVGGDKQTAAELGQLKGQMVAIEQASIAKKCNIQFQSKPPAT